MKIGIGRRSDGAELFGGMVAEEVIGHQIPPVFWTGGVHAGLFVPSGGGFSVLVVWAGKGVETKPLYVTRGLCQL